MSDTPETDAKSFLAFDTEGRKLVVVLATTSESFERERDEAQDALVYIAHSGLSARHLVDYAKEALRKLT